MSQGLKARDDRPPGHYLDIRTLLFSGSYLKSLKNMEIEDSLIGDLEGCNPDLRFVYIGCPKGHRHMFRPFSSCSSHFCLYCAGFKGKKNGRKIYERLTSFSSGDVYYLYHVFTVPDHLWSRFIDYAEMEKWKRVCRYVLKKYYRGMVGGVEREHTWGDKEVLNILRDEPHLNYILPSIKFVGRHWSERKAKRIRVWKTEEELERLRKLYSKSMRKEFGFSSEELSSINVYVSYVKPWEVERLLHICDYVARPPFQLPFRRETSVLSQYGSNRTEEVCKAIYRHFKYYEGYRSIRWFGWMSPAVFDKYLRRMDYSEKEISLVHRNMKPNPGVCPICGSVYIVRGIYDNNKLVREFDRPPPYNPDQPRLWALSMPWGTDFIDPVLDLPSAKRLAVKENGYHSKNHVKKP